MKHLNPKKPIIFCSVAILVLLLLNTSAISQEKDRETPPYPEPFSKLELPVIQSVTLSNGLFLSVVNKSKVPIISLKLVIQAGESFSPEKTPGIATVTASMIYRGTRGISSHDITEQLESYGGTCSLTINPDYCLFSLSFLDEYLDEVLELLSQIIIDPRFIKRDLENLKRSIYYEILRRHSNPDTVAKDHLYRLLFKNHPYSKNIYNEDVITKISLEQIVSFYDKYYNPNNSILVLTGNLNQNTASRKVSKYFNKWRKETREITAIPSPKPRKEQKICFIDFPNENDANIYIGNIIFPYNHEDYFAFEVLSHVLGGTPNSRLFLNLRESKGYAYYAFSDTEYFKKGGVFFIRAKVRPEVCHLSITEIFEEIESIKNKKIPSFEIEQAKTNLIGNFPLKLETYDSISQKIAELHSYNLEQKHWSRYYENIMPVNSNIVFKAAKKYLHEPIVVVTGNKDIIVDKLTKEFKEVYVYDRKGILQYSFKKGEEK
ncbi:MAG: M16 family metallopeptidase [Candidatus Aminicenantaceae bacterium]